MNDSILDQAKQIRELSLNSNQPNEQLEREKRERCRLFEERLTNPNSPHVREKIDGVAFSCGNGAAQVRTFKDGDGI